MPVISVMTDITDQLRHVVKITRPARDKTAPQLLRGPERKNSFLPRTLGCSYFFANRDKVPQ